MSIKLSQQEISRLSFLGEPVLYDINGRIQLGYSITEETIYKLSNLIQNEKTLKDLKPKGKAYICGSSKLSLSTIRDTCKNLEFKVTDSVDKADFFIADSSCFSEYYSQKYCGDIAFKLGNVRHVEDDLNGENFVFDKKILEQHPNIKLYSAPTETYKYTHYSYHPSLHIITGKGVEIIYNLLAKKIPVISSDSLFKSLEKVTIDDDMRISIESMLNSNDTDNHDIALQILYNCNIDMSEHQIWQLMNSDVRWRINHPNKNKNTFIAKDFRNKISKFSHLNEAEMIERLYSKGTITSEIYDFYLQKHYQDVLDTIKFYVRKSESVDISIKKLSYEEYLENKFANSLKEEIHDDSES